MPIWIYGNAPIAVTEATLRPALGREAIQWQYTHGVSDVSTIPPEVGEHDIALLAPPGSIVLFVDSANNRALYPKVNGWLRTYGVLGPAASRQKVENFGLTG
ncbi:MULTISPECIES: hypothetical protein [unclassified Brevibacterium]|uniref:hypothetical protein n=1 Tax=unclassified Brevibacterium TaxID=2614124 RepID=UPI001103DAC3|nr:hypothetical protein [Brevibacterium sp. S22]TGD32629.1 hypothetical protein EB835_02785 [Brevibacterium sp. S22]